MAPERHGEVRGDGITVILAAGVLLVGWLARKDVAWLHLLVILIASQWLTLRWRFGSHRLRTRRPTPTAWLLDLVFAASLAIAHLLAWPDDAGLALLVLGGGVGLELIKDTIEPRRAQLDPSWTGLAIGFAATTVIGALAGRPLPTEIGFFVLIVHVLAGARLVRDGVDAQNARRARRARS